MYTDGQRGLFLRQAARLASRTESLSEGAARPGPGSGAYHDLNCSRYFALRQVFLPGPSHGGPPIRVCSSMVLRADSWTTTRPRSLDATSTPSAMSRQTVFSETPRTSAASLTRYPTRFSGADGARSGGRVGDPPGEGEPIVIEVGWPP